VTVQSNTTIDTPVPDRLSNLEPNSKTDGPMFPPIVTEYRHFGGAAGRDERAAYVAERYGSYLKGRMLDVGCDTRRLQRLLPGTDYTGIDIGGDPMIKVNLDETERLPFEDRSFDGVVCTDVLEHLEHFHRAFDELVRVCRGHLVISLPNCWGSFLPYIRAGEGVPKYYGLPVEKPADRHRWMFNVSDVIGFMMAQKDRLRLEVVEFRVHLRPTSAIGRLARRLRYVRTHRVFNAYAQSCWAVLRCPG
jgi:SAM-dependent methyltransferase